MSNVSVHPLTEEVWASIHGLHRDLDKRDSPDPTTDSSLFGVQSDTGQCTKIGHAFHSAMNPRILVLVDPKFFLHSFEGCGDLCGNWFIGKREKRTAWRNSL